MKMKKVLLGSLACCSLLAFSFDLFSKQKVEKKTQPNRNIFHPIDTYLQQQFKKLNIPGAALVIVEGDQIVHTRGFGQARPGGEAPTPQTPFPIGSLTKSFTALSVMQLVEAGKVDLDAPIKRYLPWFEVADKQASGKITVRHLLHQTSGIPTAAGWTPLADFDSSPDALLRQARALSGVELSHPVGAKFEYSNANYNLLGLIIEAVSGESYQKTIQKQIFAPLEMDRSFTSQAAAKEAGLAVGHQFWFWHPVAVPYLPMPRGSLPSGQLISSPADMGRYLMAYLNSGRVGNPQIISAAGLSQLLQGAAEDTMMGFSMGKYAMGWVEGQIGQTRILYHTGMVPDFASYMALLPEQGQGIILMINANHFMMQPVLSEIGQRAASLLAGEPPTPSRFGFLPWMMRGLLLVPVLQLLGAASTLRKVRFWQQHPQQKPTGMRKWAVHVLLPFFANLFLALGLVPALGPMRGFWRLFLPDFSLVALLSGSLAGIWSVLRTVWVLHVLGEDSS